MARPLRVEFPGACYHVINRGNFRFPVFREERERELLLWKLAEFSERFRVRVRAYCVLVNHVGRQIACPRGRAGPLSLPLAPPSRPAPARSGELEACQT